MSKDKTPPTATTRIRVAVPLDVAEYYRLRGDSFGQTAGAAAAPVLCAMARGEIKQGDFLQQPGTDLRPL